MCRSFCFWLVCVLTTVHWARSSDVTDALKEAEDGRVGLGGSYVSIDNLGKRQLEYTVNFALGDNSYIFIEVKPDGEESALGRNPEYFFSLGRDSKEDDWTIQRLAPVGDTKAENAHDWSVGKRFFELKLNLPFSIGPLTLRDATLTNESSGEEVLRHFKVEGEVSLPLRS